MLKGVIFEKSRPEVIEKSPWCSAAPHGYSQATVRIETRSRFDMDFHWDEFLEHGLNNITDNGTDEAMQRETGKYW